MLSPSRRQERNCWCVFHQGDQKAFVSHVTQRMWNSETTLKQMYWRILEEFRGFIGTRPHPADLTSTLPWTNCNNVSWNSLIRPVPDIRMKRLMDWNSRCRTCLFLQYQGLLVGPLGQRVEFVSKCPVLQRSRRAPPLLLSEVMMLKLPVRETKKSISDMTVSMAMTHYEHIRPEGNNEKWKMQGVEGFIFTDGHVIIWESTVTKKMCEIRWNGSKHWHKGMYPLSRPQHRTRQHFLEVISQWSQDCMYSFGDSDTDRWSYPLRSTWEMCSIKRLCTLTKEHVSAVKPTALNTTTFSKSHFPVESKFSLLRCLLAMTPRAPLHTVRVSARVGELRNWEKNLVLLA